MTSDYCNAFLSLFLIKFFFFIFLIFIYLFSGCTGLFIAASRLTLIAESRGYFLVVVCGLFIMVASLVAEHGFYGMWASVVVADGLVAAQHVDSSQTEELILQ